MPVTFEKPPFFARRNLQKHLVRHLAELSRRPWIGCDCKQMFPAIPTLVFTVPPEASDGLRALSPVRWAIPFTSEKGYGFVDIGNSWRYSGFGTTLGQESRPLIDRLVSVDGEDGARIARLVRIPNLHVQALWIAEEGKDRFFVDYHFAKDPLPATVGIDEFLAFARGLYDAKQASYAQARKRALERGKDPSLLVG